MAEPQGRPPENVKNTGGMVIHLYNVAKPEFPLQEVARVAFDRKNSKNPRRDYTPQLAATMKTAQSSIDLLNHQLMGTGELL